MIYKALCKFIFLLVWKFTSYAMHLKNINTHTHTHIYIYIYKHTHTHTHKSFSFASSKRQEKCLNLKLWVLDSSNFCCGHCIGLALKVAINEIIYGNCILIELTILNIFI